MFTDWEIRLVLLAVNERKQKLEEIIKNNPHEQDIVNNAKEIIEGQEKVIQKLKNFNTDIKLLERSLDSVNQTVERSKVILAEYQEKIRTLENTNKKLIKELTMIM